MEKSVGEKMKIRLTQNTKHDCDLVFFLSNDLLVRAASFSTKPIAYEAHCKWFKKTVVDTNTLFFLVFADESEREFVGQIRFNRESESAEECVISLSITEQFRGRHMAGQFIELGIAQMRKSWYTIRSIVAEVKGVNASSNALFLKEGFELVSSVNTYKLIILPNGDRGGGDCRVTSARHTVRGLCPVARKAA